MDSIAWIWVVIALIVGSLFGSFLFPNEVEVIKNVNVPIEVIKEVEVIKFVNVVNETDTSLYWLDKSIEEFWKSLEDEEDEAGNSLEHLLKCNRFQYDADEITMSNLDDEFIVHFLDDDKVKVDFIAKLKYDEDDERSCRDKFRVGVTWEDDEDTIIDVVNF